MNKLCNIHNNICTINNYIDINIYNLLNCIIIVNDVKELYKNDYYLVMFKLLVFYIVYSISLIRNCSYLVLQF